MFDQLHGRGAGDGLGHRGNSEHKIERHWLRLVDLPPTESAFVEDAAIVGCQRNDAGNETRIDRFPEDVINSHCWLSWQSRRSPSPPAHNSVSTLLFYSKSNGNPISGVRFFRSAERRSVRPIRSNADISLDCIHDLGRKLLDKNPSVEALPYTASVWVQARAF